MQWPGPDRSRRCLRLGAAACWALLGAAALAQAPKPTQPPRAAPPLPAAVAQRDLVVELRAQSSAAAHVVSTQPAGDPVQAQAVRVKNGQEARMRLGATVFVQWTQAAGAQVATRSSAGASGGGASSAGGAVANAMTALPVGQALTVRPRWPGGSQPVTVELEVNQSALDASTGAAVPAHAQRQLSTTVTLPLGQWVSIASTGGAAEQAGVYSSRAASQTPQALQLRVTAP